MSQRALGLDLLTRVRNIQWKIGAVFVAGGGNSTIYYGDVKSTNSQTWTGLGALEFEPFGFVNASAFAKVGENRVPTFVIGGKVDDGHSSLAAGISRTGAMIMSSNNGQDWRIAYENTDILVPGHQRSEVITGIVWDGSNFYAALFATNAAGSASTYHETLLRSSDGLSFVVAATVEYDVTIRPFETPSLIQPYCIKPANAGEIPDGFQAHNTNGDVFAKPLGLDVFTLAGIRYTEAGPSNKVEFTAQDPKQVPSSGDTSMPCYAVANAGGAWVAAGATIEGNGCIDVAFNGATFKNVVSIGPMPARFFNTVCGGLR